MPPFHGQVCGCRRQTEVGGLCLHTNAKLIQRQIPEERELEIEIHGSASCDGGWMMPKRFGIASGSSSISCSTWDIVLRNAPYTRQRARL